MQFPVEPQHRWLQQLIGSWTYESSCNMGPGTPSFTSSGTETVRALGDFWVIAEGTGKAPGTDDTMTMVITLGYDAQKKHFCGTWVGTMMPLLWVYEGTLDVWYSHVALACSTGGALSMEIVPTPGLTYYLVVPLSAASVAMGLAITVLLAVGAIPFFSRSVMVIDWLLTLLLVTGARVAV